MKSEIDLETKILPSLTQETAKLIEQSQEKLSRLNWHQGEGNLDRDFSILSKECCEKAFLKVNDFKDLELEVKIPDLKLIFTLNKKRIEKKIELKSTKSKSGKMPGSMIMSLDPNMWTIMCHRITEKKFLIRYGRYFTGMEISTHETFQDRSPRPKLLFNKFQSPEEKPIVEKTTINKSFWSAYAKSAIKRILEPNNYSWQDDLVKEIIREIKKNPKKFKDI